MSYRQYLLDCAIFITSASYTYLAWIFLHFIAAHTYVKYCVGYKWYDIILSILYIPSPYCQGLSWVIYNGSKTIATMWFVLGTYLSSILLKYLFVPNKKD